MRKAILLVFLGALSNGALAEWIQISEGESGTKVYYDPATIRTAGDRVKVWTLADLKTAQPLGDKSAYSRVAREELDCKEEQGRTLSWTFCAGHMGRGEVVASRSSASEWEDIPPNTLRQATWKTVCEK